MEEKEEHECRLRKKNRMMNNQEFYERY